MLLRRLLIRALLPLTWRRLSRMKAARLLRFGVTEMDSAWQILHALDRIDDPALRARVLQHALEEVHHAREFTRVALHVSDTLPPRPLPEREPILESHAGLAGFVAYAHVGEQDVFDQFDAYAAGIGDTEARSVFREAKLDELGHVSLTWSILTSVVPEREARRMVWKIRAERLWDVWLRFGKMLGEINATVVLSIIYAVAAPLCARPARRSLAG